MVVPLESLTGKLPDTGLPQVRKKPLKLEEDNLMNELEDILDGDSKMVLNGTKKHSSASQMQHKQGNQNMNASYKIKQNIFQDDKNTLQNDLDDLDDFESNGLPPIKLQLKVSKPPRPPSTNIKSQSRSRKIMSGTNDDDLDDLEDLMVNGANGLINKKNKALD